MVSWGRRRGFAMSELEPLRAEAVLEGVAQAVIAYDRGGRRVYGNRAAQELDGLPPLEALRAAGGAESLWPLRSRATGETRHCLARTREVDGGALLVTTFDDFTERKRAADEALLTALRAVLARDDLLAI